jgi:hypothetical protein
MFTQLLCFCLLTKAEGKAGGRRQKAEGRRQKAEGRRQKAVPMKEVSFPTPYPLPPGKTF